MNDVQQAAANDPDAAKIFRQLRAAAQETAEQDGRSASTQAFLVRHALESFLDRLNRTAPRG